MSKRTGARKAQPRQKRASDTALPKTKTCRCCGHTKPVALMAKGNKGKPSTICRQCDADRASARWHADPEASRAKRRARRQRNLAKERAQAKARYWANVERNRAKAREYARSERGRATNREAVAKYRRTHPEVVAAQREAQRAVRRGELRVALVCQIKGCSETQGCICTISTTGAPRHDPCLRSTS